MGVVWQIIAILAHEMGHWQKSHTLKGLILQQVQMLGIFYMFSRLVHSTTLFAR